MPMSFVMLLAALANRNGGASACVWWEITSGRYSCSRSGSPEKATLGALKSRAEPAWKRRSPETRTR